jgi:hypothetical protein
MGSTTLSGAGGSIRKIVKEKTCTKPRFWYVIGIMKEINTNTTTKNIFSGKGVQLTISQAESVFGYPVGEGLYKLRNSAYSVPLQIGDIVKGEAVKDLIVCTELIEPTDAVSVVFIAPESERQREAIVELVEGFEKQGAYAESWDSSMVVVTAPPDKIDDWVEQLEAAAPDIQIGEQGEWIMEEYADRIGRAICPGCGKWHPKEEMEELMKRHTNNN